MKNNANLSSKQLQHRLAQEYNMLLNWPLEAPDVTTLPNNMKRIDVRAFYMMPEEPITQLQLAEFLEEIREAHSWFDDQAYIHAEYIVCLTARAAATLVLYEFILFETKKLATYAC